MYSHLTLLTGMPRSGTSWLSQIFDSHPDVRFRLSPLFSYEFKNRLTEASTPAEWDEVLQGAYNSGNEFMNQTKRRQNGEYPVFAIKNPKPSHLVIKDTRFHNLTARALEIIPNLTVVAIVRNPCGAIHSWLTSRGEFPSSCDPLTQWRTGQCRKSGYGEFWGFDDWMQVTQLHLELESRYPERFTIVSYEALVASPDAQVQRLLKFAGLDYHAQTRDFVAACHHQHQAGEYAVYKDPKVADRWKAELQPQIREAIEREITKTRLERFAI